MTQGTPVDAVVVGAGPNGLSAAITLAQAGRSVTLFEQAETVGGGARSGELAPGVTYDICSAVHPFGVGSPFFKDLPLPDLGMRWIHPEIPFTQPLDNGRAGVAYRSLDQTAEQLGSDGDRYRRLVGHTVEHWWDLAEDALGPLVSIPKHPLTLARFGLPGLLPASALAARFKTEEAKALLGGTAGHSILPFNKPFTGSFAMVFSALAHAVGWPAVQGGTQKLSDALAHHLANLGGTIELGRPITSMDDLPPHRAALFNTAPSHLARIAGDRLSSRYRKRLLTFKHGPGLFKLDYVLNGPVPWADPWSTKAGTVHVGGTFDEMAEAEAQVAAGQHPDRPFILVAQPSASDPSRAPEGTHVLWTYTHVPAHSKVDMTGAIENQLERFAPGFRDMVISRHTQSPAQLEEYNPNNIGGDITGGSVGGTQLIRRPVLGPNPYVTSDPALFLCSATTPPGAGVHGMAGHNAANAALKGVLR